MAVNKYVWRMATAIWSFLTLLQMLHAFEVENNNRLKITSQHGFELTQTTNVQRQENLQRICQTFRENGVADEAAAAAAAAVTATTASDPVTPKETNDSTPLTTVQMEHMLVDKEHRFLYCYVPKVACTNWKRILMMLTGQWNGTDPLQIPASLAHSPNVFTKLVDLPEEERRQVLSEYTKFVVVRHPFERLLSAFRNKLESDQASALYFHQRIGRQIIRSFRPNASNDSLALGNDVTFTEFVQYLLTPEMSMNYRQANQSYNEHWEPIANLCAPCHVKYNLIGKYETLIDDSALALQTLNVDWVTFPAGQRTSGTSEKLRRYYDNLPIHMIRNLYKLYETDFKLFGYSLDDVLGIELA